jgi:hypothetical protein
MVTFVVLGWIIGGWAGCCGSGPPDPDPAAAAAAQANTRNMLDESRNDELMGDLARTGRRGMRRAIPEASSIRDDRATGRRAGYSRVLGSGAAT